MPLSTIFQLYQGGQFLLVKETGGSGENHRSVAVSNFTNINKTKDSLNSDG
jgi:hypothetical protein